MITFYAEDAIINYVVKHPYFFETCHVEYFLNELIYKLVMVAELELTYELHNIDYILPSLIGVRHDSMTNLYTVEANIELWSNSILQWGN